MSTGFGSGAPKVEQQIVVAAAALRLPALQSENPLSSWLLRAEANFGISGIVVGKTMVQYAVAGNVIPESILNKLSAKMTEIYDATDPWNKFKLALESVLRLDPMAVF